MKAKIKSGEQLLFSEGASNNWNDIKTEMIVNFSERYTYEGFTQHKNHLLIDTTKGKVDIVFTGEVPRLEFNYFEKDQLLLKVIK